MSKSHGIVWFITYVYRPPYNNKDIFFSELSNALSSATRKYENILIIGDLNIDTSNKKKDNGNYLFELCDTFSLKNLITDITCVKSTNGTSLDVLLTNKSRCFHQIATFETSLSDCYKLILTFFKVYFKKLTPKNIEYRNYKNFNENNFLYKLDQEPSKGSIYKEKRHQYDVFTNIFEKKIVRGNEGPFMTKELSKAIMGKSKLMNKYTTLSSRENFLTLKKQKNICKYLNKKTKNNYFSKLISNGVMGTKQFWNIVKPFLTFKGFLHNENVDLHIGHQIVIDCNELAKKLNEYYMNINAIQLQYNTMQIQLEKQRLNCKFRIIEIHCRNHYKNL